MIRAGKASPQDWLSADATNLLLWATLNGINYKNVDVGHIASAQNDAHDKKEVQAVDNVKGSGMIATSELNDSSVVEPLVTVPQDMVLSHRRVRELAGGDAQLLELLQCCGPLAMSDRASILIFLLHQATVANPDIEAKLGRTTPFIEYLKFIPIPPLPTLLSETDLSLFAGTTLIPATHAKLKKLRAEFEHLKKSTSCLPKLSLIWWGEAKTVSSGLDSMELADDGSAEEEHGLLNFEDWLTLDAMYRSRALEWPGSGEAMVPGIDMANHNIPANAEFEVCEDGDGVLLLKQDIKLKFGDEVFISYGDAKSPLEIYFSYGFLPTYATSARSILLPLQPPGQDPLGPAKAAIATIENCVPGVRIYESQDTVKWDSEVLWLMVLNEEDGIGFTFVYDNDGDRELRLTWNDEEVKLRELKDTIAHDKSFALFQLRATVIVMSQVDQQMADLENAAAYLAEEPQIAHENSDVAVIADKLRTMEYDILIKARDVLEQDKATLIASPAVQAYFNKLDVEAMGPEQEVSSPQEKSQNEPVDQSRPADAPDYEEDDFT